MNECVFVCMYNREREKEREQSERRETERESYVLCVHVCVRLIKYV